MHEMGIALEIIRIVRDSIPADMADARVERIHLKIGKLSAVVADSLLFCFEAAVRKTSLEHAQLVIQEVAAAARCLQCGHQWPVETPAFICPACQDSRIELQSGRELDIDSIEIATEDDAYDDERN